MSLELEEEVSNPVRVVSLLGRRWHYFLDGTLLPVLSGAEGDDDEDAGEEEEEEEDSSAGDEDEEDEESEDEESKARSRTSRRIQELNQEAARRRVQMKQQRSRADAAEATISNFAKALGVDVKDLGTKIEELVNGTGKKKGADEEGEENEALTRIQNRLDRMDEELKEERTARQKAEGELVSTKANAEISRLAERLKFNPKHMSKVLRLVNREDIEQEEDGTWIGIREALVELKKDMPELLASARTEDDDDDSAAGGNGATASGRTFRSGKKKGTGLDTAALKEKYPALRHIN